MSKHTPGPWRAEHDARDFWNVFSCADNMFVVGNEGLFRCDGTDEANARLIAAAPELLAELRVAVNHIKALEGALGNLTKLGATIAICGTKYDELRARAAIAKAKGNEK